MNCIQILQIKVFQFDFFHFRKTIAWEEISHCRVMPYGFVGGWGVRLFTQYGTVYNVNARIVYSVKKQKEMLGGYTTAKRIKTMVE